MRIYWLLAIIFIISLFFATLMTRFWGGAENLGGMDKFKSLTVDLSNIIDGNKDTEEVKNLKELHPQIVSNDIEKSVKDFTKLSKYAESNNIVLPKEVDDYLKSGDKYKAVASIKKTLEPKIINIKGIRVIQIIYTQPAVISKETAKYEIESLKSKIENGTSSDNLITALVSKYSKDFVTIQDIEKYTCESNDFDMVPELKEAVNSLKKNEVSQVVDRKGYSYVVAVVTKSNNMKYCNFNDFINDL